jgi:hypothetical protein
MNDPIVNARREQALARMAAASTQQSGPNDTLALTTADIGGGGTNTAKEEFSVAAETIPAGHTSARQDSQQQKSFQRQKKSQRWAVPATCEAGAAAVTPAVELPDRLSCETIEVVVRKPIGGLLTAVPKVAQREEDLASLNLTYRQWEDY